MSSYINQTGRKRAGRKARLIIHAGRKFANRKRLYNSGGPQATQAPGRGEPTRAGQRASKKKITLISRKPASRTQGRWRGAGAHPSLYPTPPPNPLVRREGEAGGAIQPHSFNQIGRLWFKCVSAFLDATPMLTYNRGSLSGHKH